MSSRWSVDLVMSTGQPLPIDLFLRWLGGRFTPSTHTMFSPYHASSNCGRCCGERYIHPGVFSPLDREVWFRPFIINSSSIYWTLWQGMSKYFPMINVRSSFLDLNLFFGLCVQRQRMESFLKLFRKRTINHTMTLHRILKRVSTGKICVWLQANVLSPWTHSKLPGLKNLGEKMIFSSSSDQRLIQYTCLSVPSTLLTHRSVMTMLPRVIWYRERGGVQKRNQLLIS